MSCHSRAANFVLGLNELQADCDISQGGVAVNQLRELKRSKLIDKEVPRRSPALPRLVNPYDSSHELEARARSYLHVNCSACHVEAGGGNSRIVLNLDAKREDMQLVGVFPQHQTFGLLSAMLVAGGEPQRSILYHRISRRGPGQMPPRGSHVVDHEAVRLIHDWIAQLPPQRKFVKNWMMDDLAQHVNQVNEGRQHEAGARLFKELGCLQCHRFASGGGGAGPDLTGIAQKRSPRELLVSILEPSKQIAPEFAATTVVTSAGKTLEGRITQEDDQKLVLHTADALAEPVTVLKDEIDQRHLSNKSTMPDGLLNTLQKFEILDLLAYILADADPEHPIYAE
jgi:putative heme-binding domain-containing protein